MTASLPVLAALLPVPGRDTGRARPRVLARHGPSPRCPPRPPVTVVQATPGMSVDVSIDGEPVLSAAPSGQVSDPIGPAARHPRGRVLRRGRGPRRHLEPGGGGGLAQRRRAAPPGVGRRRPGGQLLRDADGADRPGEGPGPGRAHRGRPARRRPRGRPDGVHQHRQRRVRHRRRPRAAPTRWPCCRPAPPATPILGTARPDRPAADRDHGLRGGQSPERVDGRDRAQRPAALRPHAGEPDTIETGSVGLARASVVRGFGSR